MKRFLQRFVFLLPIPLTIIGANYFIDPANLFRLHGVYEQGIVDYLLQGHNVANVENYDERILQKYFVEQMSFCPEVIVLGSSRVMLINKDYFEGQSFLNNAVSGASLEDDLAIYYLYEKKACRPRKIIFGSDPWLFNEQNEQFRWRSLHPEYLEMLRLLNLQKQLFLHEVIDQKEYEYAKYNQLISFSYFKNALKISIKDRRYYPTQEAVNDTFTRRADGSISEIKSYRDVTEKQIEQRAYALISSGSLYSLENYTEISERTKHIFERFVEHLQNQNIEIEFVLTPYHPIVYSHFERSNSYRMPLEVEKYFIDFAARKGINIRGSYNPAKYNLDNNHFYDGMHCNVKGMQIILEDLKSNSP